MFQGCTLLQWIYGLRELVGTENDYQKNNIYLSSVKNMFDGCKNLNLGRDDLPIYEDAKCDLRYWDCALSTVDSFEYMFRDCKKIQNVYKIFQENFNTYVGKSTFEKLESFKEMFSGCTELQELTYFGTNFKMKSDTLKTIEGIVSGCSALTNFTFIPTGCTFSKMDSTGMNNAFYNCHSLSTISLITGNTLKSYVDIDTLGTGGSTYSTWDTLFAHLGEEVCFDFSKDIKPDADLKEGLIYLPPVPAAVEAFTNSILRTQMGWQAAETV